MSVKPRHFVSDTVGRFAIVALPLLLFPGFIGLQLGLLQAQPAPPGPAVDALERTPAACVIDRAGWCWLNPTVPVADPFGMGGRGDFLILTRRDEAILFDRGRVSRLQLPLRGLRVWGTSASDVYVGIRGDVQHFDGSGWNAVPYAVDFDASVELEVAQIAGSSPTDVYVLAYPGRQTYSRTYLLWHYDGAAWERIEVPSELDRDVLVYVAPNGDLYVHGPRRVYRRSILGWVGLPRPPTHIEHFTAGADSRVYIMATLTSEGPQSLSWFDGDAWSHARDFDDDMARALVVDREGVLYLFGGSETLTFDGASWGRLPGLEERARLAIDAGDGDFLVVGDTVHRFDGTGFRSDVSVTSTRLGHVAGWASDDVYASGGRSLFHFDGTGWARVELSFEGYKGALWAAPDRSLFVVSNRAVLRLDPDGQWHSDPTGVDSMTDIWGTSSRDVFVTTYRNGIVHFDGSAWTQVYAGTERLNAIWGSAPDDVFAVGHDGVVVHFDGRDWTAETVAEPRGARRPSGTALEDVWGTGPDDIYAVGIGTLLRFDGEAWQTRPDVGRHTALRRVFGLGPGDVHAFGWASSFVYDNGGIVQESGGWTYYLRDFWVAPDGVLFAVGDSGMILTRPLTPGQPILSADE
jgi:hypothetical protein